MKLVNINYRCQLVCGMQNLKFANKTPCQAVVKVPGKYTLVVFPSGHARLMGVRSPLTLTYINVGRVCVRVKCVQSITVVVDMHRIFNLEEVATKIKVLFEPEIFPAARVMEFTPLCVNVFRSGKVVITGLKTLHYYKQVEKIINRLRNV